jgi:hypothetical protein
MSEVEKKPVIMSVLCPCDDLEAVDTEKEEEEEEEERKDKTVCITLLIQFPNEDRAYEIQDNFWDDIAEHIQKTLHVKYKGRYELNSNEIEIEDDATTGEPDLIITE